MIPSLKKNYILPIGFKIFYWSVATYHQFECPLYDKEIHPISYINQLFENRPIRSEFEDVLFFQRITTQGPCNLECLPSWPEVELNSVVMTYEVLSEVTEGSHLHLSP